MFPFHPQKVKLFAGGFYWHPSAPASLQALAVGKVCEARESVSGEMGVS